MHKQKRKMERDNLREVTFSLMCDSGFEPGLTEDQQKEQDDKCRRRNGYFHKWIKVESCSPQSGRFIDETKGLIEDADTGNMEIVDINLITFKDK